MTLSKQDFFSPTVGRLSFDGVVYAIVGLVREYPGAPFRISVGTDSEEILGHVKFMTVIHVWRIGHGARAFRTEGNGSEIKTGTPKNFRPRIYEEILRTATLAQELRSALREAFGDPNLEDIEVHADVSETGGTSSMLREVIGMLKGYGFADALIKIKPEAYAASAVADHYI
ncbi:MAG: hypothetical protein A2806_04045 [Candidatus Terrybacteria bacterium RIFCSPHIGHO2_01_FULL_48_17]|uniref:Uncharacterized protein n=1 Tax=Candidatus Terrybacteria bacterium RIFCSPHIGHO2_01_FULL_48_17 TaxID=1802362 RepID=A0A1G2PKJ3_9BACT|nr:MAG: hypothetical protein A2806_04045 [Candidatus Terrybacteria bacterium RIFCSPHIGHO2_01_FULL_48_17]OHA53753.1 MAG: hypothetical protein A3A30_05290 [Candidatus Terrybacteria bacterium RIFCSPLOWO2_01_FULL_48_14]